MNLEAVHEVECNYRRYTILSLTYRTIGIRGLIFRGVQCHCLIFYRVFCTESRQTREMEYVPSV